MRWDLLRERMTRSALPRERRMISLRLALALAAAAWMLGYFLGGRS